MPANLDLLAWRTVTWAPSIVLGYSGEPLPLGGAHIAMEVRLYGGAAGAALLSLGAVAFEDVAAPTAADADARTLTLSPIFTPAQLGALPGLNQPEAGCAQVFRHDVRITYADGASDLLAAGAFIVQPGVTTI